MPSLRTLTEQAPLLLLDAASTRIQVGLLTACPGDWRWQCSTEEAGVGLFECLAALGIKPSEARAFAFCEGPGSILGIRSVAAALRAWQVLAPEVPIWSYRSLDLLVAAQPDPEARVIADARRDSWHLATRGQPMRRVPTTDLGSAAHLCTPDTFRCWSKLPESLTPVRLAYDLAALLPGLLDADLFMPAAEPDAFLHEEPSYATWTPEIHRAPVVAPRRRAD